MMHLIGSFILQIINRHLIPKKQKVAHSISKKMIFLQTKMFCKMHLDDMIRRININIKLTNLQDLNGRIMS